MTTQNPMFPPTTATRRGALIGIAAAGLAPAAAGAISGPPGIPGPATGTPLSGVPAGLAGPPADDPIYALIAEHREAIKALHTVGNILADMEPSADGEAEDAVVAAADRRFGAALVAVLTVQPTTMAGVAALLEHLGTQEFLGLAKSEETILSDAFQYGPANAAALQFPRMLAATVRRLAVQS
jgi:hypothetical protein